MKMKLVLALSAALLAAPSFASHPQCGETELAGVMGDMKDAMKAYKKAFKAGDDAKMTQVSSDLLKMIDKSTDLVPLKITDKKELNAAEQAKFEKYQKGMNFLKEAVTKLHNAENADAKKAALKMIGKASKKGHKAFKMKCDD